MFQNRKIVALAVCLILMWNVAVPVRAQVAVEAPSVVLIEASTGKVIYELNAAERRCPASITKIMTLLLTFEQIEAGKISLKDEVLTSAHASSMGGSQVYLAEGETQTLETMIKCIVVASGNDACVAVAEHIAGSEEAFVDMMNKKAADMGLLDTHFEDCCGLTDSDNHYTSAKDVALMSRELTTRYPEIFEFSKIWMEDITHETKQGTSNFTLNSTNKLLKQYQWATGLKTGSTSKAKYCISATASKDGIDLIAVVMGAPDPKARFRDASALLSYGFSVCDLYVDANDGELAPLKIEKAVAEEAPIHYAGEFRYLDIEGNSTEAIERIVELPETVEAPVAMGDVAGYVKYQLNGKEIGNVPIVFSCEIPRAGFGDYFKKAVSYLLI